MSDNSIKHINQSSVQRREIEISSQTILHILKLVTLQILQYCMMASTLLYGYGAQAVTILLILLGFTSCCPIGHGCMLPSYQELASGKADRDLTYNITAEVNIDREHNLFRPTTVSTMLKNPPDSTHAPRANGQCQGYRIFNNSDFSDAYIQNAVCPWKYECDYDAQRLPATLFYARCLNRTVTVNGRDYYCTEVYHPMSTIRTSSCDPLRNSTQEWEWERVKNIPVGCIAIADS